MNFKVINFHINFSDFQAFVKENNKMTSLKILFHFHTLYMDVCKHKHTHMYNVVYILYIYIYGHIYILFLF